VGDAAQIRAMVVRHQKTDVRDAVHLMKLIVTNRFPRIWIIPERGNEGLDCRRSDFDQRPNRITSEFSVHVVECWRSRHRLPAGL
jgi:hypothetical protein